MRYFLYRVFEQPKSLSVIPIDYMPGDGVEAVDGDLCVVYIAGVHTILGIYEKKGDTLVCVEKSIKHLTIKDIMAKLSFVSFVNDKTIRMFKKKCRELSDKDFEMIKQAID